MDGHNVKSTVVVYHNIDRQLYARLVGDLGFDIHVSMKILAFWNWLESCGYPNIVITLLHQPDTMLYILTKQANNCLYFLITGTELNPYTSMEYQNRYTTSLIGTEFSHWFLYGNREIAMLEIGEFVDNVCVQAFHDLAVLAPELSRGPWAVRALWANLVGPRMSVDATSQELLATSTSSSKYLRSIKERTMYVSFSRKHPISDAQLLDFFIGKYGIGVEHIDYSQCFARIVLDSIESISKIFESERLVKLSISGKVALAQRFVTMQEAIDTHHLWPRNKISHTTAQVENFFNTRSVSLDLSYIFEPKPQKFWTLF